MLLNPICTMFRTKNQQIHIIMRSKVTKITVPLQMTARILIVVWMTGSGATLVTHYCFWRERHLDASVINASSEILALATQDYQGDLVWQQFALNNLVMEIIMKKQL